MTMEAPELTLIAPNGEKLDLVFTPYEETNDPNVKTHFVRGEENEHIWLPGMTGQDIVDIARFRRLEVTALCGHKWVPVLNPDSYDICQPCTKIWENLA